MKKLAITTIAALALATTNADYTIKVPLQTEQGGNLPPGSILLQTDNTETPPEPQNPELPASENWQVYTPEYSDWINHGQPFGCTNWSPDLSTITVGQPFIQTADDCNQEQTRTRQEREQETTTLAIRDTGSPIIENQTITSIDTRDAVGTLETWIATTPTYTDWVDIGVIYGCSNWSPAPSTVTSGQSFIQTATDCKQGQNRSRQDREQESTTLAIRDKGITVSETQTLTVSSTRSATGTKEIKVCKYDENTSHGWNVGKTGVSDVIYYYWDGVIVGYGSGYSIIVDGYMYTATTRKFYGTVDYVGWASRYEICREPI